MLKIIVKIKFKNHNLYTLQDRKIHKQVEESNGTQGRKSGIHLEKKCTQMQARFQRFLFFLRSRRTHIDIDKKELQDEIVLLYCRKIGDGIATQITIYKSQWIEVLD